MKHLRFEKSNFVEDYKEALVKFAKAQRKGDDATLVEISKQFEEPENLYMDPDHVDDCKYTPYFHWLTLFLNLSAWECVKPYKFVAPSDAGTDLRSEAKNPKWFFIPMNDGDKISFDEYKRIAFDEYKRDQQNALKRDPSKGDLSKILVFGDFGEKGKGKLRLFSDQLGFTAIQGDPEKLKSKWKNDRYPLYRYLRLAEDKNAAADFISRYVYDTRTLGGAFVWPTDCVEKDNYYRWGRSWPGRRCEYNFRRGAKPYIEDRVDLTLLEVKSYFDGSNIVGDKEVILLKDYVMHPSGEENMEAFLGIFESFEDYVDFFMLNAFVEDVGKEGSNDYVPKDITTDKPFERNEAGEFVIGDRLSQRDLSEGDLKEILGRVQSWTMERTGKMEEKLEEKLKDCAVC